ncbi:hypothetical protein [Microvirga sp. 17 mud 1-3]|uniref:hypothetical protein n=1 Tax=Microvirga sp. 17 mud 1-3 TaxID=2082949 RepID=UPI000D6A7ECB|nr:hypothetical protein [Microvirga sp. 17 mud 1-3]AWM87119.1 hypothetical protein C4E04_10490 [Microvirga sp. 17 mud 1-3]
MTPTGSHWTYEAVQTLIALVKESAPASVISLKLKRLISEVRAKIDDLGLANPREGLSRPERRGPSGVALSAGVGCRNRTLGQIPNRAPSTLMRTMRSTSAAS